MQWGPSAGSWARGQLWPGSAGADSKEEKKERGKKGRKEGLLFFFLLFLKRKLVTPKYKRQEGEEKKRRRKKRREVFSSPDFFLSFGFSLLSLSRSLAGGQKWRETESLP